MKLIIDIFYRGTRIDSHLQQIKRINNQPPLIEVHISEETHSAIDAILAQIHRKPKPPQRN